MSETTPDALERRVAERWPDLALDAARVAAELAARAIDPASPRALDVALMVALAGRDPAALAVFEGEIVPDIRGALARFGRDPDFVEEALQRVRVKVLVGEPASRILEYRGRGPLVAWLQIVALREALMLQRADAKFAPSSDDDLVLSATSDPVLARTRQLYGTAFSTAFREALADLGERERTLLRLCFAEKLGAGEIATLFRVHRVTAFRWLKDARAALLEGTRRRFSVATDIATSNIDSVMRDLAQSLSVAW